MFSTIPGWSSIGKVKHWFKREKYVQAIGTLAYRANNLTTELHGRYLSDIIQ